MKKIIIILLINLLTAIACFSENIYPILTNDSLVLITTSQLKTSNLIFLEHNKLLQENNELKGQLNSYDILITNYNNSIELKDTEINILSSTINEYSEIITIQNKQIESINKQKKIYTGIVIGSITISVSLILTLLLITN